MNERRIGIGPSILTADWLRLGDEINAAEMAGADFLHLDVMDGRFVPNISFGPLVVAAIRNGTNLALDVHLMIEEPSAFIPRFLEAGANSITVHVEGNVHLNRLVQAVILSGAEAGVAVNPATPLSDIEEIIPIVHRVLVMSVNPGFGGQTFIPSSLDKIRRLREMLDRANPGCEIRVDGGVKTSNIARIADAGANSFVVGAALFTPERPIADAMVELRSVVSTSHSSASS